MKPKLNFLILACALVATTALAQTESAFCHPHALAPADAPSSGGGSAGAGWTYGILANHY